MKMMRSKTQINALNLNFQEGAIPVNTSPVSDLRTRISPIYSFTAASPVAVCKNPTGHIHTSPSGCDTRVRVSSYPDSLFSRFISGIKSVNFVYRSLHTFPLTARSLSGCKPAARKISLYQLSRRIVARRTEPVLPGDTYPYVGFALSKRVEVRDLTKSFTPSSLSGCKKAAEIINRPPFGCKTGAKSVCPSLGALFLVGMVLNLFFGLGIDDLFASDTRLAQPFSRKLNDLQGNLEMIGKGIVGLSVVGGIILSAWGNPQWKMIFSGICVGVALVAFGVIKSWIGI